MKITQDLVNRTRDLLRSYECLLNDNPDIAGQLRVKLALLRSYQCLLNDNPDIAGQLRVKLATAELCLFKIAALMQEEVDNDKL